MDKKETSDAQKRAMKKYETKFDTLTVRFPKGTIDLIHEHGISSVNAYINKLIEADLIRKSDDKSL